MKFHNIFRPILFLIASNVSIVLCQQQDPSSLNGGSALAMTGKDCVALAIDKRFGSGPQMVNISPRRTLVLHSHLMVAFTGLEGDIATLSEELSIQASKLTDRGSSSFLVTSSDNDNRQRRISPKAMSSLTSHVLYERRSSPFYVEPLIVGLEEEPAEEEESTEFSSPIILQKKNNLQLETKQDNVDTIHESISRAKLESSNNKRKKRCRPFLCSQDVIGAQSRSRDFICAGVASKTMYGISEAMWKPDMDRDALLETCGKAFLSALERDCLSGYGATLYLITPDGGIIAYDLDTRND